MIIFEWSGLGWLSPLIALLSVFAGLAAAGNGHGWDKVLRFVLVLLVGAGINHLVALRLNSMRTPQGRRWRGGYWAGPWGDSQQHSAWYVPMQTYTGVIVELALIALSVSAGFLLAPATGWLVFLAPNAAMVGCVVYRRRGSKRPQPTAANNPQGSAPTTGPIGQASLAGDPSAGDAGLSVQQWTRPESFDLMMGAFFGGSRAGASNQPWATPPRGEDVLMRLAIAPSEAAWGAVREVRVPAAAACRACGGTGAAVGSSAQACTACGGHGEVRRVEQSLVGTVHSTGTCPGCGGAGSVVLRPCGSCGGEGRVPAERTVMFKIPAGMRDSGRLRLAAQGEAGLRGGPAGDLYVQLQVDADEANAGKG